MSNVPLGEELYRLQEAKKAARTPTPLSLDDLLRETATKLSGCIKEIAPSRLRSAAANRLCCGVVLDFAIDERLMVYLAVLWQCTKEHLEEWARDNKLHLSVQETFQSAGIAISLCFSQDPSIEVHNHPVRRPIWDGPHCR